jgi:hypothetical protein
MNPEKTNNDQPTPRRELSRRERITRRLLPAVALSLAAGGYAAHKVEEKAEYHDVASVTYRIGPGQAPIDAVRDSVDHMSITDDNGEEADITGVVREGQEVSGELQELSGSSTVQAGESIEVTVSKNGFGDYKLEADPAEKTS